MKSTVEYLDAFKAAIGVESDYAAAKALGVTRAAVSRYRTGVSTFDDEVAFKIAEALDVPEFEVFAAIRAERSSDARMKVFWADALEKFSVGFPSLVSRADARQLSFWPV